VDKTVLRLLLFNLDVEVFDHAAESSRLGTKTSRLCHQGLKTLRNIDEICDRDRKSVEIISIVRAS
jgi:hypothetical protein